jgi:hypothetical protein
MIRDDALVHVIDTTHYFMPFVSIYHGGWWFAKGRKDAKPWQLRE